MQLFSDPKFYLSPKRLHTMKQNKSFVFLPNSIQTTLKHPPLVILNGFNKKTKHSAAKQKQNQNEQDPDGDVINRASDYHKQIMAVMFKHMFAPMNVIKMRLSQCRRVVFFDYDHEHDCVELRHYKIQLANNLKGVSKGVKRLIGRKGRREEIPDLAKYEDVTDYVKQNKDEYMSESEAEDDENTKIVIDKLADYNKESARRLGIDGDTSYVRLREIGPRITMELFKIDELVNDGKVLYHRYITKTEEEKKALQRKKDEEKRLKAERKAIQELNVRRKEEMKKNVSDQRIEQRKQKEVAKLLKSFEMKVGDGDEDKDEDDDVVDHGKGKGKGKGVKRRRNNPSWKNENGAMRKKRKFNKQQKKGRF